jgi:hypothetical protein
VVRRRSYRSQPTTASRTTMTTTNRRVSFIDRGPPRRQYQEARSDVACVRSGSTPG